MAKSWVEFIYRYAEADFGMTCRCGISKRGAVLLGSRCGGWLLFVLLFLNARDIFPFLKKLFQFGEFGDLQYGF